MRQPQFSLKALLVATLAIACFFGGIQFERERRRREDERAAIAAKAAPTTSVWPPRGGIEETLDKFDYPVDGALRALPSGAVPGSILDDGTE